MITNGRGFPITPSDSVALPKATSGLYVGVTGNVAVLFGNRNGLGRVTAIDASGAITAVKIEGSGFGYNAAPTATVVDSNVAVPTGTGATITVTVANGIISALTITVAGTGYHINDEITMAGGFTSVILTGLQAGIVHPIQVTKVLATGTTATSIIGFYN